jgi:hypothetical protein
MQDVAVCGRVGEREGGLCAVRYRSPGGCKKRLDRDAKAGTCRGPPAAGPVAAEAWAVRTPSCTRPRSAPAWQRRARTPVPSVR